MDAGLRGFTVGGAQISEKHCGFVVNKGGATAEDVRNLICAVQKKVQEDAGVKLEPEVKFLGEFTPSDKLQSRPGGSVFAEHIREKLAEIQSPARKNRQDNEEGRKIP